MKITIKEPNKYLKFRDLKCGDVFVYAGCDAYFLKISNDEKNNVFPLSHSFPVSAALDSLVEFKKSELIIGD